MTSRSDYPAEAIEAVALAMYQAWFDLPATATFKKEKHRQMWEDLAVVAVIAWESR